MIRLAELVGKELKWTQPHASKMEYELHAGDLVAATLRFRSSFGSFATATTADGVWTFKRVGFSQTKVTIRASETEADLAVFKNNTWKGGGTLELPDGRKYPANTNFWSTQYEFKTETGEPLISYRKIGGLLHMSSTMEVHPLARDIPELAWMVSLGWYLTIMMYEDSAAMAGAVTAVS
jgi:hypothetical protein